MSDNYMYGNIGGKGFTKSDWVDNSERFGAWFTELFSEIPSPQYNPEDVAFKTGLSNEELGESNYGLITLKRGEFQVGVDGTKHSSIVGDCNFDIDYWSDFGILDIGGLCVSSECVMSILALDEDSYNNAKEYGHMLT